MHVIARLLLAAAAVAALVLGPARLRADGDEPVDRECLCGPGAGACQHFLRNPKAPTDDPCWCNKCRTFSQHDGGTCPDGMNPLCFQSTRMDCYLKRHSVAWNITCSECAKNVDCCKYPNHAACPNCEDGASDPLANDVFGNPGRATVLDRLEKESRLFKKPKGLIVAYDRNFYIVTDVDPMKVKTPGGSFRMADTHEWVHLMIERAEYARREWVQALGSAPLISRPTAIYIPSKERDAQTIQATYFGSPRTNILYGGSDKGRVADGFCFNGFCQSEAKFSGDVTQHYVMRHSLGHIFISCWTVVDPNSRALPPWMFVGAAHWLCKWQERFRDEVTFCGNETTPLTGSGKDWEGDCGKLARAGKFTPIEELFGKTASGQLTLEDHKRAWGYFHFALTEWREPFVKVLADLRRQKEPRDAFMEHMNCTPEVFHERWMERMTGKRRSLDPTIREDDFEGNEPLGVRERRKMERESDPQKLAAMIRGQGTIGDVKVAEAVIDQLAKNSELVRETVVVTLLKIQDPEVLEAVWQYGLAHKDPMCRAYTARVCGRKALEFALPALRKQLEDSNWYARAEAAVACGLLHDIESMSKLRPMVSDSAEKARVAAMDALAMFGEEAEMSVPLVVRHLESPRWQLRVAACQTLAKIGSMEAVEPLITRMEIESGRVRGDIYDALKAITRDDLGRKPENWRAWWEREKANTPNGLPKRPDAPEITGQPKENKPDPDDRYAQQEYYGIEIYSSRIGFVLDTSGSMETLFVPDPAGATKLGWKDTSAASKITICKREIARTLETLDPRSHFNIVAFNTAIRSFSKNPVPASGGNVKSAQGFMQSLPALGETNYYDSLRAILDLGPSVDSTPNFESTPDTLTFLTDGMPTAGEMTDADTLLEWYTTLNRYARVRTHVICFGTTGVDLVLLRGLAERNDGKFVMVAEQR